jgi:hypothetical protein
MSIADTLIKQILAANQAHLRSDDELPPDAAPIDGLLRPEIFTDAPDLDVFRDRLPDCGEEFPDQAEGWAVLGTYRFMASPGFVTLYRRNIEAYWKSLLCHAHRQFPFVTSKDAERVLSLLVNAVYQHERFHYVCDFCRRVMGGARFDRWHEEALAVASEWHWLKTLGWNSYSGLMHPTLRRHVVQAMFDHRAPGYRDWRQFANQQVFHDAVSAYLYPAGAQTFAGTTFSFGAWAVARVADDSNKAWEEHLGP